MVGWGRSRYAVTDLGEARPNWGPKGRKIFLRDRVPRLSQDLRISGSQDGRPPSLPPSLIWRAGSATGHVRLLLLWTIILKLGTSKNLHRYKRGNWLGKNSMYSIWIFGVYNVRVFNPNPSLKVEKLMHCKVVQPSSEKGTNYEIIIWAQSSDIDLPATCKGLFWLTSMKTGYVTSQKYIILFCVCIKEKNSEKRKNFGAAKFVGYLPGLWSIVMDWFSKKS